MDEKRTILVVDDEKDIREIIEIYLMNEGYNIVLACDGIEALEKLKKEKIDLIILDIMICLMLLAILIKILILILSV